MELQYWGGVGNIDLCHLLPTVTALVAIIKGMQAVKVSSDKIFQFLTVVVVVCFTCDVMSATWQLTRRQNEAGSGHHPAS